VLEADLADAELAGALIPLDRDMVHPMTDVISLTSFFRTVPRLRPRAREGCELRGGGALTPLARVENRDRRSQMVVLARPRVLGQHGARRAVEYAHVAAPGRRAA
jgi:hypothetical protein